MSTDATLDQERQNHISKKSGNKISSKIVGKISNEIREKSRILAFILALIFALLLIYFAYVPTSNLYGKVISRLPTSQKIVALTFDDGPNGEATIKILQILKRENVPATFFLIGDNVLYYPQIPKLIVDQGSEVENHTMHHDRVLPFNDSTDIKEELLRANQVIHDATGYTPKYFRPPFGFRTPWAIAAAQKAGFTVVTWNQTTRDFAGLNAKNIENKVLAGVRPGSIIDLHDGVRTIHGANRNQLIQALPFIIQTLKQRGYSFVTISQMQNLPAAPTSTTAGNH